MGCWNGTCAISHLPILAGERVKLILLKSSKRGLKKIANKSAYVYSNDLFSPASFAISGVYNDYGGIKNIDKDIPSKLLPLVILFGSEKFKAEEKEYNTLEFLNGEEDRLEILFNAIERGELEIFQEGDVESKKLAQQAYEMYSKTLKSTDKVLKEWKKAAEKDVTPKWRKPNLSFVLIREDVWDHLITNTGNTPEYYDRSDNGTVMLTGKEYYKKDFFSKIDKCKKHNIDKIGVYHLQDIFSKTGYAGGNSFKSIEIFTYTTETAIKEDKLDDIFKPLLELRLIESFMSGSRRGWIPQAGAGSQHDGWNEHKLLAELIVKICDQKVEEYEEDVD